MEEKEVGVTTIMTVYYMTLLFDGVSKFLNSYVIHVILIAVLKQTKKIVWKQSNDVINFLTFKHVHA